MIDDFDFLGVMFTEVAVESGIGEGGEHVFVLKAGRVTGPKSRESQVIVLSPEARLDLIAALEAA